MRTEAAGPARENQYTDTQVRTEDDSQKEALLFERRELTFVIRPRIVIGPVVKFFGEPS